MGLGGPVWHASARAADEPLAWALAERALDGVGDPRLGQWRERGRQGVMHIRRRLTLPERARAGGQGLLCVRDIRGTEEEERRRRLLLRDAPYLREFVEAMRAAS